MKALVMVYDIGRLGAFKIGEGEEFEELLLVCSSL
jgi:hypothetical protein